MSALLVVGADHLGKIPSKLASVGFEEVIHISGRKVQQVKKEIPSHVDLVLILTDYINHNLTSVLKKKATDQGIPICYAKRSWCSIYQAIDSCDFEHCKQSESCRYFKQ
ncbi:DUF2325 domain-containing protein [Bacillus alkalicellulosilyticus]|uniref:DUF2325 domain-containing protein n=1 Tax=Alkalihalobacterium alkalicellulosilyticum TaxID=1912214 RepID=UPI0009962E44|nr:DUF2325 domain-containing protein [Bacillus alkalicellulosilyticus]